MFFSLMFQIIWSFISTHQTIYNPQCSTTETQTVGVTNIV